MKKTAIYSRVSTIDQRPELQSEKLLEYVNETQDLVFYKLYEDKTTGAKTSRPALDKLMKDARAHNFQHVVFWKVGRLGRNAIHVQTVANEWKKLGITFTITSMNIDTSNAMGRFIFGVMAQFAEMERDMGCERSKLNADYIKRQIEKNGYYVTKEGKKITKRGRPKGSRDKNPRRKSGYYRRWANE